MTRVGTPWRCWERLTLAGVLNGPEGLLTRVALRDTRTGVYQSEFRWPSLVRLGPNDFRGEYAQITLRFGDVHWSFEMAGVGQRTYVHVRPINEEQAAHVEIRLETFFQQHGSGQIVGREDEVIARTAQTAWRIWSPSPAARRSGGTLIASLSRPFLAVIEPAPDFGRRLEERTHAEPVRGTSGAALTTAEREMAAEIRASRNRYMERFAFVPRELWWAYAAVPYGLGWNMIWAQDRQEPIQVCSRDWCVHGNYGEWVLFNWDQFLLVPAAADYDTELAHQIIRPQFAVQEPDGLIPGIASPLGVSGDRGMPPVAALSLWKAYLRTGDRTFVTEYYEKLVRYYEWWQRRRDGNGDGLLEWGSDAIEPAHPQWQAHTAWASRYETGMDNHPMWDDIVFNTQTNTQEQSDIGLNALHATEARCLAAMSELLGKQTEAQRFAAEATGLGRRVDEQLWDDSTGLWMSRKWDGTWNPHASPCCFYPLFLAVRPVHIVRAVEEHLRNPKRFGGRYLMPVSPRDDPAYQDQYYVRGRIWPAQCLLVHSALREARQEKAAAELARGCLETMRQEWLEEGHLHENYHAETADGDDTPESDPLYSFGPMMALPAWYQMRDVLLDGTEVRGGLDALTGYIDNRGELRDKIDQFERMD